MTRPLRRIWRVLALPLAVTAALLTDHLPHHRPVTPARPHTSVSPALPPVERATPTRATRRRAVVPPSGRRRVVTLDVTAYTWTGHRTASGVWPARGQAASNLFPFGTKLRVPGIGIVKITDRIGAHSQLDIYLPSEWACRQFGRRQLRVVVLS